MKIKTLSIALASMAIFGMVAPAYAADKPNDFNNMLNSLSNILSSTNPKSASYKTMEPASGTVATDTQASALPPTALPIHSGNSIGSTKRVVTLQAVPAQIAQPRVDVDKLSPETKRLLQETPSNINGPGKKEAITMKRGDFDSEYGRFIDENPKEKEVVLDPDFKGLPPKGSALNPPSTADKQPAPPPIAPQKAKFDITIENGRNAETVIDLLDKGYKALNAGQYEVAITYYKAALEKEHRSRDGLFGLATAYQKAGQKVQARDAYAKLLTAYPKFEPGWNNLLVLAGTEAPKDALKQMDEIGARNPNFAPVYAQKAAIYEKMGDDDAARDNLLKALTIDQTNVSYRYNLAILLDKNGEIDTATKLYNQLLEQNAKGAKLPVDRAQIVDRMAFIGSQKSARAAL